MSARGRLLYLRARAQGGFTMIIALGVMLVTSLLLVAVFTAANGDIFVSHENVTHQQAYYAALAGVQEYEYKLEANSSYWENCESLNSTLESGERFEVTPLAAEDEPKGTKCSTSNPFETMIESSGAAAQTFRILSVGCAGKTELTSCQGQSKSSVSTRSVVATFKVTGFLDYVYFTQYEDIDPTLNGTKASNCEKYYEEKGVKRASECETLIFTKSDSVSGPMHTDDAANVTCSKEVTFGREGHKPADTVEINGGTWPACGGSEPEYFTESGTYSKGTELVPPPSDESLSQYVESANLLEGATHLVLNGSTNTIKVTNAEGEKTLSWPANGLLYVQEKEGGGGCEYTYKVNEADSSTEPTEEENCGTVYVQGTYSKSLTIAGTDDVIINGSIYPTSVAGKLGSAPTGTASLGLIATDFVRVYHPCTTSGFGSGTNGTGSMTSPWIYAAILSTSHSFLVDNYKCGATLGNLGIYGAIAQKFRGPVGQVGSHGYLKEYIYDQRVATEEPPYFLSPLKTGWKVARETSPTGG